MSELGALGREVASSDSGFSEKVFASFPPMRQGGRGRGQSSSWFRASEFPIDYYCFLNLNMVN